MIANQDAFKQAVQHLENGQHADCEKLCHDLLRHNPAHADTNHILALCYRARGKFDDAEKAITRALSQSQENASILNSRGLILLDLGKAQKAYKALAKALKIQPNMAAAHANIGHAQRLLSHLREAEVSYREALSLNPRLTDALIQLALLLRKEGRLSDLGFPLLPVTSDLYDDPGLAMVQGLVALDENSPSNAERAFKHALKKRPRSATLWTNLGLSLAKQNKTKEAENAFATSIEIDPSIPEAHVNMADLWKYDSPELARNHLAEAIKLNPKHLSARDMLGFTWFMDREFDVAINCFNQALQIDQSFEQAAFHRAGAYFLKGELSSAWPDYNRRYGLSGITGSPVDNALPLWDERFPANGPVLIWTDQGLGDEILQLGYIADIYDQDISLIIATSERLVPIAARSFPKAMIVSRDDLSGGGILTGQPVAQCPAMKLASLHWKSLDNHPKRVPYLIADEMSARTFRQKYRRQTDAKPLVGISWRSANTVFGAQKSLKLADLLSALEESDCTFVDLQYGETDQEIGELPGHQQQRIISDQSVEPLKDMDTFASQVRALDIVITTSNTTAHISGALGTPTWTLVPRVGPGWLWYWFDKQTRSPWYPHTRLFRQTKNDGWASALSEIQSEFSGFIKEFQSLTGN